MSVGSLARTPALPISNPTPWASTFALARGEGQRAASERNVANALNKKHRCIVASCQAIGCDLLGFLLVGSSSKEPESDSSAGGESVAIGAGDVDPIGAGHWFAGFALLCQSTASVGR